MNSKISPKHHLNTYIHKIINHLRPKKEPVTFLELKDSLGINLMINPSLIQALKKNPRIEVLTNTLCFKPLYELKSISDLERLLVDSTEGIDYNDLVESNEGVKEWIVDLGKRILFLKDADETRLVFWNPVIVEKAPVEVLDLFQSVKVPNYTDIVAELSQAGLKIQKSEVVKKPIIKMQNKKYKRKTKITNTHVKELDLEED